MKRWLCGILILIALGIGIFLVIRRPALGAVALTFERYNYLDALANDHCAFFRLTNGSDRTLMMTMVGGKNTMLLDRPITRNPRPDKPLELSWQLNGAFRDKTPQGWSN